MAPLKKHILYIYHRQSIIIIIVVYCEIGDNDHDNATEEIMTITIRYILLLLAGKKTIKKKKKTATNKTESDRLRMGTKALKTVTRRDASAGDGKAFEKN